ncbi:hypothetical protein ACN3VN_11585 [Xylella fastidiosa]|uniref:hypothetical protein n=1 Tax=Xylella fastidiosa TaxID=2371 RepID=UPI001F43DE3D|nr:hypothetical protein [Xylella fastidiosa]
MPSWLIWKGSHDEWPTPRRHDQAGAFFFGALIVSMSGNGKDNALQRARGAQFQ